MLTITPFLAPPNVKGGYDMPEVEVSGLWGATYPPLVTDQCGSDDPYLAGSLALGHALNAVWDAQDAAAPLFAGATT